MVKSPALREVVIDLVMIAVLDLLVVVVVDDLAVVVVVQDDQDVAPIDDMPPPRRLDPHHIPRLHLQVAIVPIMPPCDLLLPVSHPRK